MIEIEKKFFIKDGDFERLTKGAKFVSEKILTDTYYDRKNYSLTTTSVWLRKRNEKFEIKSRLQKSTGNHVTQYEELDKEEEIRGLLEIQNGGNLEDDLKKNGLLPFCSYKTTRKKYKKGPFTLDFDLVDFGDFTYEVLEIELMVKDKSKIKEAEKKIVDFAKENGLDLKRVMGKAKSYLKRNDPKHYQALVDMDI